MNLRINGEEREVPGNLSLQDLVIHLDLTPERIAIELNQNVVRRAAWPSTVLLENDRVEIVHFVGGGRTGSRRQGQKAGGCKAVRKKWVVDAGSDVRPEVRSSSTFRLPIRYDV